MAANFEELEADMHRIADEHTGDEILLKIPPALEFTAVKGHVIKADAPFDAGAPIDPLNQITRVKLRKELWPAPDRTGRLRSAKLGPGTFQIAGDPDDGASHWLFDVQEVDDD